MSPGAPPRPALKLGSLHCTVKDSLDASILLGPSSPIGGISTERVQESTLPCPLSGTRFHCSLGMAVPSAVRGGTWLVFLTLMIFLNLFCFLPQGKKGEVILLEIHVIAFI